MIENETSFELLAVRVSTFARTPASMDWIRDLEIEDYDSESDDWAVLRTNFLLMVILNARSLRCFHDHCPITLSTMMVLASTTRTSLKELTIVVNLDDVLPPLQLLGLFVDLRVLSVGFKESERDMNEQALLGLAKFRSLNVRAFEIYWPDIEFSPAAGVILSQCRFENLAYFRLDIPELSPAEAHHIQVFIIEQHLHMPMADLTLPPSALDALREVLFTHFEALRLQRSDPSPSFFDAWTPQSICRKFILDFSTNDNEALWDLLEALVDRAEDRFIGSDFTLSFDLLRNSDPVVSATEYRFRWAHRRPSKGYAAFSGTLMHYARLLNKKGIKITDHQGYTFFDRTP